MIDLLQKLKSYKMEHSGQSSIAAITIPENRLIKGTDKTKKLTISDFDCSEEESRAFMFAEMVLTSIDGKPVVIKHRMPLVQFNLD